MPGLEALAAYLPRHAVRGAEIAQALGTSSRGIEEVRVLGPDEDAVTLAVEAGGRALAAAGVAPESVGSLVVASREAVEVATIAEALGMPSPRAKVVAGDDPGPALLAALDFCEANEGGRALFVAVGTPADPADPAGAFRGAGAAAVVCGPSGIHRELAWHVSAGAEESWEALLVRGLAADAAKVARVFGPEETPRSLAGLERRFPGAVHAGTSRWTGDLGPASPLLALATEAASLPEGEPVLLLGRSATGASGLHFTARRVPADVPLLGPEVPRRHEPHAAQLRRTLASGGGQPSQGAYVSPAAYAAELPARYRLVGEECLKCAAVLFPPRETCPACGSRELRPRALRRIGTVYSYTVIGRGAAPSEFAEQQALWGEYATALVALDDGPRIAAMLTDTDPADVRTGMPVAMAFRRLYVQEGAPRYGFKFRPI